MSEGYKSDEETAHHLCTRNSGIEVSCSQKNGRPLKIKTRLLNIYYYIILID